MKPRPSRHLVRASIAAAGVLLAGLVFVRGQEPAEPEAPSLEYRVKAAYLYNFSRNIEWPKEAFGGPRDPFVIGVVGVDPFGSALDKIARTREIKGRKIVARRFKSAAEYTPCHILFVPSSQSEEEQRALLRRTQGAPVLAVGESPGFAQWGGAVNFYTEDDTVRFEINPDAATKRRLQVNYKVLQLARIVKGAE